MSELSDKQVFVNNALEASIKIGAIFLLVSWCYDILKPFITPLFWAAIIAVATYPIAQWLERRGLGKKLSATIVSVSLLAILITPTVMLTDALVDNITTLKNKVEANELHIPKPEESVKEWPLIGEKTYSFWASAESNLEATLTRYQEQIKSSVGFVLKQVANFGASIAIFIFFYHYQWFLSRYR